MEPGAQNANAPNFDPTAKATRLAQINPTALSDVPTDRDGIGFYPYVRAIAWFLTSEKTKPPLTLSVEGPWGSGKSSFILQLEKEIRAQASDKWNQYYVRFNAWRSDKDEALWAAFALTFINQIQNDIPLFRRISSNVSLLWKRLDWKRGWFQLALFALSWIVFLGVTIFVIYNPLLVTDPKVHTFG